MGDPKQLEATSEFFNTHIPNAKGGLQEQLQHHTRSAMQRLTETWAAAAARGERTPECKLRTQYRMHDSICQVVDAQFYRGKKVRACCLGLGAQRPRRTDASVSSWRCHWQWWRAAVYVASRWHPR